MRYSAPLLQEQKIHATRCLVHQIAIKREREGNLYLKGIKATNKTLERDCEKMNGSRTLRSFRRVSGETRGRFRTVGAEALLIFMGLLLVAGQAWAGPPFFTDDPEPVEYLNWEVYLASQWTHDKEAGTSGTLPHLEVNYGPAADMHLHVIVPAAYSAPGEGSTQYYGLGDMELGVKYRFIHEDEKGWKPQVGTFPIVVLPTGSSSRGLGEGHVKVFFPLWLQKSWGTWTTYGGGGYWYHPGEDNRNYWFTGWLLQRELSRMLTIGAEIFNTSPKAKGETDETGFNAGGSFNLSEEHHILFSAGRDFKGPNTLFAYLAFQWTFGPKEEGKAE